MHYIYGFGLMAMVTPSDEVYCYHYNATGSTVAMTDSSQTMVNKYTYDPFGKVTNQEETIISQPFKFVGQFGVMTEPNGFYYMRARYYDPNVGRFISEDPIGFEGGDVNLYAYVGNNPVNLVDPNGLFSFTTHVYIGYMGGREAGRGRIWSALYGLGVAVVDLFTLDSSKNSVHINAMVAEGQTSAQAIKATLIPSLPLKWASICKYLHC